MRPKPFTGEWFKAYTEVEPGKGCLLYMGFADPSGYCRVHWKGKAGMLMHRVAYELAFGPFDPAMKICHRCDVPNCINPRHLYLGTQKDNVREMFAKGRARPRGKATAPLTSFPAVSAWVKRAPSNSQTRTAVRKRLPYYVLHAPSGPIELDNASVAPVPKWKQVTGVPSRRPTQAIDVWQCPNFWTAKLVPASSGFGDGADLSRQCAPVPTTQGEP